MVVGPGASRPSQCAHRSFPNLRSFVALKDGQLFPWGDDSYGGSADDGAMSSGAPAGNAFVSIASNTKAFAALRQDGSLAAWGYNTFGGRHSDVPDGNDFVAVFSNARAFAALRQDGRIAAWGSSS